MAWRVARSLDVLLGQLNAVAPNRSRASDGSIGDEAHQRQGSASDHNPWFVLGGQPLVTARDYTHDPAGGLDCNKLAAALAASRDPRIKYLIWQGRIMDSRPQFRPWTWQPSSGHYQHLHLSVMASASADDPRPWSLPGLGAPTTEEETVSVQDVVRSWYEPRFRGDRNFAQVVHNVEDLLNVGNAKLDGLVRAVGALSNDPDLTPDQVRQMLAEAMTQATPALAGLVSTKVTAELRPELVELLGEDNAAQADEILARIADRLRAEATPTP